MFNEELNMTYVYFKNQNSSFSSSNNRKRYPHISENIISLEQNLWKKDFVERRLPDLNSCDFLWVYPRYTWFTQKIEF
jgi:hypothetical protein